MSAPLRGTELDEQRQPHARPPRNTRTAGQLMRFGMVTTFYPPFSYGGDATYVRNLAKALVEQSHDVEVIASTEAYRVRTKGDDQVAPSWGDGVTVHRMRHRAGLLVPQLRDRPLGSLDRLRAASEYTAQMHRANGIKAPIDVVPLFSSIERAGEAKAANLRRIVFAGRVTALKGIERLRRVVAAMPDVEL